ncbi:MAG: hypothetical protein ABR497_02760 [Kiritimatiellia bacterium]|nr:hypothetical protein [Lentisphaerota bacterium]
MPYLRGWMWAGLCGALLLGGCRSTSEDLSSFLQRSRRMRLQPVAWEPVTALTFDTGEALAAGRVVDGEWEVRDGRLWAVAGDGHRAVLLLASGWDPVRIEFDAACFGVGRRLGDITILLNTTADGEFFKRGYALTTGSFWNHCTTFYRDGMPLARTEYSPLLSGRVNRVVLEFNRGHIRYWLNDEIILEAWDEAPQAMLQERWIGIRTWDTLMWVDNLRVSRGLP